MLCVGALLVGSYFDKGEEARAEPHVRAAVTAYFDAVVAEDYAGAYRRFCKYKELTPSLDLFREKYLREKVSSYEVVQIRVQRANDTGEIGRADVYLKVTGSGHLKQLYGVRLEEDGVWRVCTGGADTVFPGEKIGT